MPSTWEERADEALGRSAKIIAANDERARHHPDGYDDARDGSEYATGCGTMVLLALLPLAAALATWMHVAT